jgi:hypothetical protein
VLDYPTWSEGSSCWGDGDNSSKLHLSSGPCEDFAIGVSLGETNTKIRCTLYNCSCKDNPISLIYKISIILSKRLLYYMFEDPVSGQK